jgi:hypothetical protein
VIILRRIDRKHSAPERDETLKNKLGNNLKEMGGVAEYYDNIKKGRNKEF